MSVLEACPIQLSDIGKWPKWGGWFARYEMTAGASGEILAFSRTPWPGHDQLQAFVRLDQFEPCARRWRFAQAGKYQVFIGGGTTSSGWEIRIEQDQAKLTLRIPR